MPINSFALTNDCNMDLVHIKDGLKTRKKSTKPDMKLRYCLTNTNYSCFMVAPPTQL